jgi:hypothetical protein
MLRHLGVTLNLIRRPHVLEETPFLASFFCRHFLPSSLYLSYLYFLLSFLFLSPIPYSIFMSNLHSFPPSFLFSSTV